MNGAYGFGLTEQEAKDDFMSVLEEQAEYYKKNMETFLCGISLGILLITYMI